MKIEEEVVKKGFRLESKHIVLLAVVSGILALTDAFFVIAAPILPGVSTLYMGGLFAKAFIIWFGIWGLIGGYIGPFIGGVLTGMPIPLAAVFKLADFFGGFCTFAWKLMMKEAIELKSLRSIVAFLVLATVIDNVIGGLWGAASLAAFGIIPWSLWWIVLLSWSVSTAAYTLPLMFVLRYLTKFIKGTPLYVKRVLE